MSPLPSPSAATTQSSTSTSLSPTPPPAHNTRLRHGITKPITKLNLSAVALDTEPRTITQALKSPVWRQAMDEEISALLKNNTWDLVPPSPSQNVVTCKWIFRIKKDQNGNITKYKARYVARGFNQRAGIDYSETFSPVVKPSTVRLVLSIAVSNGWSLRQLDINNAFLQGTLTDDVYTIQPPGYADSKFPHYVCKLNKALYGLKQAPRAWYKELRQHLLDVGFKNTISDSSLFTYMANGISLYLIVYVDDIIVTGNTSSALDDFVVQLAKRFSLKDLGPLSYFLGVEVLPHSQGIFLSQKKYIADILCKANMDDAKPVATPMATDPPLTIHGQPLADPTSYRTLIGSLQYLGLTRPDVSFAVNKLAQYMQRPTEAHMQALRRLLRYLQGTSHKGLLLYHSSPNTLHAYSDSDWARDKDDYISTTAYIVYLGNNAISWTSKKQRTRARSSTEAEYRAVANTTAELLWVRNLLVELGCAVPQCPVIYCDNAGATYVSANPVFHSKMKHLGLDYHFVRENVQAGLLRVSYISTHDQLADVLTKPLPRTTFHDLIGRIGLSSWPSNSRGRDKDRISQSLSLPS